MAATQPCTLQASEGTSQIDFVFTPMPQAWGPAKQARVLSEFSVASWRGSGRHYPVLANAANKATCKLPRIDTEAGRNALHEQGTAAAAFCSTGAQALKPWRMSCPLTEMVFLQVLHQACLQHSPLQSYSLVSHPPQCSMVVQAVQHTWQLRDTIRAAPLLAGLLRSRRLSAALQVWKQAVFLSHAVKAARKASRQAQTASKTAYSKWELRWLRDAIL